MTRRGWDTIWDTLRKPLRVPIYDPASFPGCEGGDLNPHTEVPDSKSGASTNSATFAWGGKYTHRGGGC